MAGSPQILDFAVTTLYNTDHSSVPWLEQTEADSRYARTSHTHAQGDITGLASALAGKSDVGHTHILAISNITNLQDTLDDIGDDIEAVFNRILTNGSSVLVGNGHVLYGPA